MSTERPYAPPDDDENDVEFDLPELGEDELDFREMRQEDFFADHDLEADDDEDLL